MHDDWPSRDWYDPAAQSEQLVAPLPPENLPDNRTNDIYMGTAN